MEQNHVRYGVYAGLGIIIFTLLLYLINPSSLFGYTTLIGWVVYLYCMYSSANADKTDNNGFISFRDAFKSAFLVFALASLMGIIFQYLLINVIDTSLAELQLETSREATVKIMEALNASEDDIEKALEQVKNPTIMQTVLGYCFALLFGAIPALIIAAIIKKDDPRGGMRDDEVLDDQEVTT